MDSPIPRFIPRAYQNEIFARAREENVVCAMETGSGKTYIAVLLIRWITAHPENFGKKVVFVVPKVPLVEQQTNVLKEHTSLRVNGYYGALGVDMWNRQMWMREFEQSDVLVMTAQILYDVFLHAHWTMDKLSLIVFDEAHHCQKKHPYAKIMDDHYSRYDAHVRPKVFGLTASPVWNPQNPAISIMHLEQKIRAKVIAVTVNQDELDAFAPKPKERKVFYTTYSQAYPSYPSPTLWEEAESYFLNSSSFEDHSRRVGKYNAVLEATGPFGADYWVYRELNDVLRGKNNQDKALDELERRTSSESNSPWTPLTHRDPIHDVLERHEHRFSETASLDTACLSPKFASLVAVLLAAKSASFQGIVFAEQRSVAAALTWMLCRVPSLAEWLRCAALMGHGVSSARNAAQAGRGMQYDDQHNTVKGFRDGRYNLLVATNVAEEGLDFQACHLIVRFDPLRTLVGYVQSRGRARRTDSEYVVMLAEGGVDHRTYEELVKAEPSLKEKYRSVKLSAPLPSEEMYEDEDIDEDTAAESYVIKSTGACLTAYASIPLVANLCSLIPRDQYCPIFQPTWNIISYDEGHYSAEISLPAALPLKSARRFQGPIRRGKQAAKSSAAYLAMRKLHELNVFDDWLLPGRLQRGDSAVDADGNSLMKTSHIPTIMDISSRDPFGSVWAEHTELWLHPIYIDGAARTGIVTARPLDRFDSVFPMIGGHQAHAYLGKGKQLQWPSEEDRLQALRRMDAYFVEGVGLAIGKIKPETSPYLLVPILGEAVDFAEIETVLRFERTKVAEVTQDSLFSAPIQCILDGDLLYALVAVRGDLSPLSTPPKNSREYIYGSYHEYYVQKRQYIHLSSDQPLLELRKLKKHHPLSSTLDRLSPGRSEPVKVEEKTIFIPQSLCRLRSFSLSTFNIFRLFPSVIRHITDLYRLRLAQENLGLPETKPAFLVEALTVPAAGVNFSFQRLETLGDAVLKLSTSVHVFNKYPHRHEGQLDMLRSNSVNNTYLLSKAREVGLVSYLITERSNTRWKPPHSSTIRIENGEPFSTGSQLNRKCLSDVMEALLGATFLTGGIHAALEAGTALGLCFGGEEPWELRDYVHDTVSSSSQSTLLSPLEETLHYSFQNWRLLLEALTHPTFCATSNSGDVHSYQRLEFLGDAVIDLYVTDYLFRKYPEATPGQLTWAKSRSVCNPVLGTLSAKVLHLQKYMLAMSPKLETSIKEYIAIAKDIPYSQLVVETWNWDPPKALADLFEAVIGAVFVDSGFNLSRTIQVLAPLMTDVLAVVGPKMPRDPTTELMIWANRHGCTAIKFMKSKSDPEDPGATLDCVSTLIHGIDVSTPMLGRTISLSKYMASARTLAVIKDEASPHYLEKICRCKEILQEQMEELKAAAALNANFVPDLPSGSTMEEVVEKAIEEAITKIVGEEEDHVLAFDTTTEGFAYRASVAARLYDDVHPQRALNGGGDVSDVSDDDEEKEVESDLIEQGGDMDLC